MQEGLEQLRQEFLSETQEILESAGRDLLALEEHSRNVKAHGDASPVARLVQSLFRGVHSLKGVSGLFGYDGMAAISHRMEDVLDRLRMNPHALDSRTLDLLFDGIELLQRFLALARHAEPRNDGARNDGTRNDGAQKEDLEPDANRFFVRAAELAREAAVISIEARSQSAADTSSKNSFHSPTKSPTGRRDNDSFPVHALDDAIWAMLSEHEEQRLRQALVASSSGKSTTHVIRLRKAFSIPSLDADLEEVVARLSEMAEVLSYLPVTEESESSEGDTMRLDILILSSRSPQDLRRCTAGRVEWCELKIELEAFSAPMIADAIFEDASIENERLSAGHSIVPKFGANEGEASRPVWGRRSSDRNLGDRNLGDRNLDVETLASKRVHRTVRVDIERIEELMNVVSQLDMAQKALEGLGQQALLLREDANAAKFREELQRIERSLKRSAGELQDGLLGARMIPLTSAFERMARATRQVGRELGKDVRFVFSGDRTLLDKTIVDELSDSLLHLVRNAVDHGIEPGDERVAISKERFGTIRVHAEQAGSFVRLELADNGRGIDPNRIVDAARAHNLLEPLEREKSAALLWRTLLFRPGLSTSMQVSDVSGRGVGLDVVRTNIARLGGAVEVSSEPRVGTRFTLTLPLTVAVVRAILFSVDDQAFALSLHSVGEVFRIASHEIEHDRQGEWVARKTDGHEDSRWPVLRAHQVLGTESDRDHEQARECFGLVLHSGIKRWVLLVDDVEGQRDLIVKPLGQVLSQLKIFAGAALIGEQRTVLVVDPAELIGRLETRFLAGASIGES